MFGEFDRRLAEVQLAEAEERTKDAPAARVSPEEHAKALAEIAALKARVAELEQQIEEGFRRGGKR